MEQTLKVSDVNAEDIDILWPRVQGYLQSALDHGQGEYNLEDIRLQLIADMMRLWIVYDSDGEIHAAAVCEIKQFPQKRICYVVLAGGVEIDNWLHDAAAVEQWARENGADAVVALTRKGMAKKLREFGYREVYTVVQQDITDRRLH